VRDRVSERDTLWVHRGSAFAFSADTRARPTYPGSAQAGIQSLLRDNTRTRCFNAEDLMTPNVSTAFSRAAELYFTGTTGLSGLLTGLERTQGTQYDRESETGPSTIANFACSKPGAS
jgi:hypothetical protein